MTTKGNGRISTTEWMCCGPLRETDEDGITTGYGYNSAKQLVETIRSATETTPEMITSYSYDAAGRTIATRRDVGAMTTMESTEYDNLGRTIATTDVLGRVTRNTAKTALPPRLPLRQGLPWSLEPTTTAQPPYKEEQGKERWRPSWN